MESRLMTQSVASQDASSDATSDSRWQRLLALSGVAFAVPFLIGWFASAGVTPHYSASDQDWTDWAHDSKWNGRVSGFAMLVAAFLFAAMGFATLMASGVLTLQTRVFARWMGIVALVGATSFLVTFLTVLDGTTDGSPFGYGFFPGVVALVTWTIAASIARYRTVAT
jgi:hypothetical protein